MIIVKTLLLKNTEEDIKTAAELLKNGGVVGIPTETVYGLAADALNPEAVKKIFKAKGRPGDNPLIVHICDFSDIERLNLVTKIPDTAKKLADAFWPGPLTMIMKKSDVIPNEVSAGLDTVAIRFPSHKTAQAIIRESGTVLAAPSANRSKHISPTTAQHVYEDLQGQVELILDDGPCGVGIESTVLDLTCEAPTILRPGAITAEMLLDIVGQVSQNGKVIKIAKAPGMKYTHYAPVVETVMAENIDHAVARYDEIASEGRRPVIVARDIYRDKVGERAQISLGVTIEDYTRCVYNALHVAEKAYDYIIIERLDGAGLEASVMNRVEKVAGGKCV